MSFSKKYELRTAPSSNPSIRMKLHIRSLLIVLLLFVSWEMKAQQALPPICASDVLLNKQRSNPKELARLKQQDAIIRQMTGQSKHMRSTFSIPVVVHIIHTGGPENISDAQVNQAISDLNNAFANSGNFQDEDGIDTGISFCLAKQDENGQFTTGINRIQSSLTNLVMESDDQSLKSLIQWNPYHYLNIWLVNSISSSSMGPGVAGYSTLPDSHGSVSDGIVNEAGLFGSSADNSKVHIHEAGHYCGLYHTFEGGCTNNDCTTDNDQVCDTPPDASVLAISCNANINTCTSDSDDPSTNNPFRSTAFGGLGDQDDLFHDYMDYGYQTCQSLFTEGQRVRMITALQQIRTTLLESHGCLSPCTNPITASFSFSPSEPINVGASVQFTSSTLGGVNSFEWFQNNSSFSTVANPSYTFTQDGTMYIQLEIGNGDVSCAITVYDTITVVCPVQASFSVPSLTVAPGDSLLFTNTGSGFNSVQWYLDGSAISSAVNLLTGFPNPGQYLITQVSSNGQCEKASNTVLITVGSNCNSINAGPDQTACAGTPIQLHGTAPGINDIVTTHWTGGNGTYVPNDNDPNALYYPSAEENAAGEANLQFHLTFGSSTSAIDASLLAYDHSGEDSIFYISPVTGAVQGVQSNSGHDLTSIGYQMNSHLLYGISNIVDAPRLYEINVITNVVTMILDNLYYEYWAGDFDNSHQLFYSIGTAPGSQQDQVLHVFDMSSGTPVNITLGSLNLLGDNDNNFFNNGDGINGLAFDPSLTKLYGVSYNGQLYDINITSGNATLIGNTQSGLRGLAYDFSTNKLWGCDNEANLFEIDKNTGSVLSNVPCLGDFFVATSLTYAPGILPSQQVSCLDSLHIDILAAPFVSLGPDTAFCSGNSIVLSVNANNANIAWQDGSINSSFTATQTGEYSVSVTDSNSCVGRDTIQVLQNIPASGFSLGPDRIQCDGGVTTLSAPSGYASTQWSSGSNANLLTVYSSGNYWLTVTDLCHNSFTDSIRVTYVDVPNLELGNDTVACATELLVIDAGTDFSTYTWNNGSQTSSIQVTQSGTYWVRTTTPEGCNVFDSLKVEIGTPKAPLALGNDTTLCGNDSLLLQAPAGFSAFSWNTGAHSNSITVNSEGLYWLQVNDSSNCISSDTIYVHYGIVASDFEIPNAFSPNGDAMNDVFSWEYDHISDFHISLFNRWGNKLYETDQPQAFWTGENEADGTYFYVVNYTESCTQQHVEKKGTFTLLH